MIYPCIALVGQAGCGRCKKFFTAIQSSLGPSVDFFYEEKRTFSAEYVGYDKSGKEIIRIESKQLSVNHIQTVVNAVYKRTLFQKIVTFSKFLTHSKFLKKVSPEIAAQRLGICTNTGCPYYFQNTCTECGCFVSEKTRYEAEDCDHKKWTPEALANQAKLMICGRTLVTPEPCTGQMTYIRREPWYKLFRLVDMWECSECGVMSSKPSWPKKVEKKPDA